MLRSTEQPWELRAAAVSGGVQALSPTEQELLEIAEQIHDTTSLISCSRRRTLPPERVSVVASRSNPTHNPSTSKDA